MHMIQTAFKNNIWSLDQFQTIVNAILAVPGVSYVKGREEYTLLRQVIDTETGTEVSNFCTCEMTGNPVSVRVEGSGANSPICGALPANGTTLPLPVSAKKYNKPFLAPLDIQKTGSIADVIPSFRVIQSESMSINIGFDTEFQACDEQNRRVLSLQMSIALGYILVRYFFLVDPRFQEVTNEGGLIPMKYCLADILEDLKNTAFPDFPRMLRKDIIYKEKEWKGHAPYKVVDFRKMKAFVIPVTVICHTGKADISVFRRSKYDVDLLRKLGEIQGGWMTTENVFIKAEGDKYYNSYWLLNLCVRDTLGLTPADNKSLKALGNTIKKPKIELSRDEISNMTAFALQNPVRYFEYAMNDADIVVSFCSELFRANHNIPMTLSSAAASSMYGSIKQYFNVTKKADFDRIYRGLEMLDEGVIPTKDECMKFLKATRYVPIRDNPDAKLISEYFEETYTGGFNASFNIGWITEKTTDFDLQNAYPTAMANIIDIDWSQYVRDFPRHYDLSLQDLPNPLIPAVAVGDFDFPDDVYCPCIPVPVKGGLKIYPRQGRHVYMAGPDMYLALQLGARINIFRGFTCRMLQTKDGKPSQCLAYAVTNLVQDRMKAKKIYKDNPLMEKSLKTMVNSCYGKTAQNVSPKTRYNAKLMGRVDAEPSTVTSPYHAAYTTSLVRCMLIACINQLHDMGYHVYSVTTDGFITDASTETVRGLDAFGFTQIFQNGRYILNQTRESCEANQVWEPKHYNDVFLNITTRGNVAVNDEGVLAHNSYTTGEIKDSRADRDAYIIAVLSREGRLKCKTNVWTEFSEIVERKHDFEVRETIRELSMNFDYKRCPIVETAADTPVHYESADGKVIDTVIAEYDTRPFDNVEEFLNYRKTIKNGKEDCIKVKDDLERIRVKSTAEIKGYIGKDLNRKILTSIICGYRAGLYGIPALDGLKQKAAVEEINSWGIAKFTIDNWKKCGISARQENMLPFELVEKTLNKIIAITEGRPDE